MACFESRRESRSQTLPYVTHFFPGSSALLLTTCIVTIPYNRRPSLNFPLLIARYIRQFTRTDPKEALQYVYCLCLTADQGEGVGNEQIETAWDLCRKVIVSAEAGGGWEELVGGFRPDGIKYVSLMLRYYSVHSCNSRRVASWTECCHFSNSIRRSIMKLSSGPLPNSPNVRSGPMKQSSCTTGQNRQTCSVATARLRSTPLH